MEFYKGSTAQNKDMLGWLHVVICHGVTANKSSKTSLPETAAAKQKPSLEHSAYTLDFKTTPRPSPGLT